MAEEPYIFPCRVCGHNPHMEENEDGLLIACPSEANASEDTDHVFLVVRKDKGQAIADWNTLNRPPDHGW